MSFFIKIASKQPLLTPRWIMQNWVFFSTSIYNILFLFMCLPNLTHSFLKVYCNVQRWWNFFFPYAQRRQQSFRGHNDHFLRYIWNVALYVIIPKWVRYMSTKSHIHKSYGTLKNIFSIRGYAKIYLQKQFIDNFL